MSLVGQVVLRSSDSPKGTTYLDPFAERTFIKYCNPPLSLLDSDIALCFNVNPVLVWSQVNFIGYYLSTQVYIQFCCCF